MFNQLFFRSDALTRQLSAPLVDERRQYLAGPTLLQSASSSQRGVSTLQVLLDEAWTEVNVDLY
jgi:hypothetical protein